MEMNAAGIVGLVT